jgi:hypothetical protein
MHNNAPERWLMVWIKRVPGLAGSHPDAELVRRHLSGGRPCVDDPRGTPFDHAYSDVPKSTSCHHTRRDRWDSP